MGVENRGQVYGQTSSWDLCLLLALGRCVLTCLTHGFSIKKKKVEKNISGSRLLERLQRKYHVFWTIRLTSPKKNLGGKWGCVL